MRCLWHFHRSGHDRDVSEGDLNPETGEISPVRGNTFAVYLASWAARDRSGRSGAPALRAADHGLTARRGSALPGCSAPRRAARPITLHRRK